MTWEGSAQNLCTVEFTIMDNVVQLINCKGQMKLQPFEATNLIS